MIELQEKILTRQDFVDNSIFELINNLNPSYENIEWNTEMIGEVRDVISRWLVENLKYCKEEEFYS